MEKWIDVTRECELKHWSSGVGYIHLMHQGHTIGLRATSEAQGEYRVVWGSHASGIAQHFRIERRVDVPDIKYTRDYVQGIDWSQVPTTPTVRCCEEHHLELNNAGIYKRRDCNACPACQKWDGTGACPLATRENDKHCYLRDGCCNGLWVRYSINPTAENAAALYEYIKAKRIELEAATTKKAEWKPKLWERCIFRGKPVTVVELDCVAPDGARYEYHICSSDPVFGGCASCYGEWAAYHNWCNLVDLSPMPDGGAK